LLLMDSCVVVILAVVSPAINMAVQISLQDPDFNSFGI
jgi:hypothetical protein